MDNRVETDDMLPDDACVVPMAEVRELRSHVSRLEESLRVALEARAEAVEVLREVEWLDEGGLRVGDAFPQDHCSWCNSCRGDGHEADCRLARAIGGGR